MPALLYVFVVAFTVNIWDILFLAFVAAIAIVVIDVVGTAYLSIQWKSFAVLLGIFVTCS